MIMFTTGLGRGSKKGLHNSLFKPMLNLLVQLTRLCFNHVTMHGLENTFALGLFTQHT